MVSRRRRDDFKIFNCHFELFYMQLHQISAAQNKKKKRIGRGGKRGTFSGRGVKGQKSRAGRKMRPEWRDALKKIPKKRGYKFGAGVKPLVFNLGLINKIFKEGEIVSVDALLKRELADKIKGRKPKIKILGDGEINKKLNFKGLKVSVSAKEKIEKAGGKVI